MSDRTENWAMQGSSGNQQRLNKLNHYGFCGVINDWCPSYLNNRTQTTQVGQHISDKAIITCGVPQGSVLSPLLFLLHVYVNVIHKCSNKLRFYLFADDTNVLYADKNLKVLETTINIELGKFYVWLTANKLTLNTKKIKFHSLSSLSKTACLSAKNLHV